MIPITLTVSEDVISELHYMVDLHQHHGAANAVGHDELVGFVWASVADGSRRAGRWERSMLESMGSLADGDEHQQYRASCGFLRLGFTICTAMKSPRAFTMPCAFFAAPIPERSCCRRARPMPASRSEARDNANEQVMDDRRQCAHKSVSCRPVRPDQTDAGRVRRAHGDFPGLYQNRERSGREVLVAVLTALYEV